MSDQIYHSLRRRVLFALGAIGATLVLLFGVLAAADVYVHTRVQNLAGVNIWGYRGPAVGRKQPGEVRIVVLGGSTAFGYGLPRHESFAFGLERKLNAHSRGGGDRYTVVNLGAPGQGAYGFLFDLQDYKYLRYDAAILYEGYNDLGSRDLPEAVPARSGPNYFLFRRQSPVFRLTGYFPILPLVLREKAMALRAGGQLDAAYRGKATFRPGLATRATAAVLQTAAGLAEQVQLQLGPLTRDPAKAPEGPAGAAELESWRHYVRSVLGAVRYARDNGVKVAVVTQPYASDAHVEQQRALSTALADAFGRDPGVRYVNLGPLLNIRDRAVAYDGLHLVAAANDRVADALTAPVRDLLSATDGAAH